MGRHTPESFAAEIAERDKFEKEEKARMNNADRRANFEQPVRHTKPQPQKQVLHYEHIQVSYDRVGGLTTITNANGDDYSFTDSELREFYAALQALGRWNEVNPDSGTVHYRGGVIL